MIPESDSAVSGKRGLTTAYTKRHETGENGLIGTGCGVSAPGAVSAFLCGNRPRVQQWGHLLYLATEGYVQQSRSTTQGLLKADTRFLS